MTKRLKRAFANLSRISLASDTFCSMKPVLFVSTNIDYFLGPTCLEICFGDVSDHFGVRIISKGDQENISSDSVLCRVFFMC